MHLTEDGIKWNSDLVELDLHILGVLDSGDRVAIEMKDGTIQLITTRKQWSTWSANAGIPPNVRRLSSTITCPNCKAAFRETMPVTSCLLIYECRSCGFTLNPKDGHCCVFCSFGDIPCPSRQQALAEPADPAKKKKFVKTSSRPGQKHGLPKPKRRTNRPCRRSRIKPRKTRSQGAFRRVN